MNLDFNMQMLMDVLNLANGFGIAGGVLYILSISRKTLIPLRVAGIASGFCFLCSGILAHSLPAIFLYGLLLPLNCVRLWQMLRLIRKVRAAAAGDLSMDWLKPFMTRRKYTAGQTLFHKGDIAKEMFIAVTGRYRIPDLAMEIHSGQIFGELGLLTTENHRTQTIECVESGHVLTIRYDEVWELYFDNPEFGVYFLRLISERLLRDVARLEARLQQLGLGLRR
jgi:Cyclic nucleotide-binding domain